MHNTQYHHEIYQKMYSRHDNKELLSKHPVKHKLGFKTRVGINLMEFSRHRGGPVIIFNCKCFRSFINDGFWYS